MGQVICGNDDLKADLEKMCENSSVLNVMLYEVLEHGDLAIHITMDAHSWYDQRTICLGLKHLPNRIDVLSTLIMEICNAFTDKRGMKPLPEAFDNATDYGEAIENQEWHGIKKHIKILKQLNGSSISLGHSRFKQAFENPDYGWTDFEKYLEFQREQGHTAQIESHWAKACMP